MSAPSTRRDTLVGAIIAIAILGGAVPFAFRALAPTGEKRFTLRVANGKNLKEQAPVRMRGLEVGRVVEIHLTEDDEVEATFVVDAAYARSVRADASADLVEPLAMGLTTILVDPGSADLLEAAGNGRIPAKPPITLEKKLEWSKQKGEELAVKVEDLVKVADRSVGAVGRIERQLAEREGLLGELLEPDPPLLSGIDRLLASLERVQANVATVTAGIDRREGAIGRVLASEELRREVDLLSRKMDETLAVLEDAKRIVGGAADRTMGRVERLSGLLGGFEAIAKEANEVGAALAEATRRFEKGRGSLGRLLRPGEPFFADLRQWIAELQDASSDGGEQGPVNIFTGVIFRALPNSPAARAAAETGDHEVIDE